MILRDLFYKASEIEVSDNFELEVDEIHEILTMDDSDIGELLIWLSNQGAGSEELSVVDGSSLYWIAFSLKSNNFRTRFHYFIKFLEHKNPILRKVLSDIGSKI